MSLFFFLLFYNSKIENLWRTIIFYIKITLYKEFVNILGLPITEIEKWFG